MANLQFDSLQRVVNRQGNNIVSGVQNNSYVGEKHKTHSYGKKHETHTHHHTSDNSATLEANQKLDQKVVSKFQKLDQKVTSYQGVLGDKIDLMTPARPSKFKYGSPPDVLNFSLVDTPQAAKSSGQTNGLMQINTGLQNLVDMEMEGLGAIRIVKTTLEQEQEQEDYKIFTFENKDEFDFEVVETDDDKHSDNNEEFDEVSYYSEYSLGTYSYIEEEIIDDEYLSTNDKEETPVSPPLERAASF